MKISGLAATAIMAKPNIITPWNSRPSRQVDVWPIVIPLGRNCTGGTINIRSKPSVNGTIIKPVKEDTVFEWEKEVVGEAPSGLVSRRWVQIPEGYVYAPSIQLCRSIPNLPVNSLPNTSLGQGSWAEVTVPFVDLILENPPPHAPWLQAVQFPRLYYSQVVWIDQIRDSGNGNIQYRVNERYAYGDLFWVDAKGLRLLINDDFAAISPEVTDKKIIVNLTYQYLRCLEGNREVYYCRCSTGAKFNAAGEAVDIWSTPPGPHPIFRKLASMHMSGGSTGNGYDTAGIGWVSLFAEGGVAIHSTFWHNDFGVQRSHGCVNVLPEDAHWIFRWTTPFTPYDPGDITVGMPGGTIVDVEESV